MVGGAKTTKGDAEVIEIASAYERKPLGAVPLAGLVEIAADRRLRIAIKPFLDADETRLQLASPDPEVRRGAAMKLGHQAGGRRGASGRGGDHEGNRAQRARHALQEALALIRLANGDPAVRVRGRQPLGAPALVGRHARAAEAGGRYRRLAGRARAPPAAIRQIERWGLLVRTCETVFQGASLASILLLMALGLAIVFGLMGVINMAHGELMALGAYATFVVQNCFRATLARRTSTPTSWWRCRSRSWWRRWSGSCWSAASSAASTAGRWRRCC